MTDKELLLKAICGYLPYALQVRNPRLGGPDYTTGIDTETEKLQVLYNGYTDDIEKFKPYLRPMSSMTEEEKEYYSSKKAAIKESEIRFELHFSELVNWFNAHYFDYRGLLDKGMALPALDGMYETK